MSYTKLANSILTSTIWMEDDQTRIVWLTLLAMADKNGEVQASIPGLANVARVSVESCHAAIDKFLGPDPYSRTKDDEGRRIEEIRGGWLLINHAEYRNLASDDDRKMKAAERQRRHRERYKRNSGVTACDKSRQNPQAEAEAEADTKETQKHRVASAPRSVFRKPTVQEVIDYVKEISATVDAKDFVDFYESNGWKVGRNSMKDWKATVRQWHSRSKKLPQQAVSAIKPEQSPEFIKALNAARSYPKDYEKRAQILGPELFEALKRTGTARVADANDFALKTLAPCFMEHLKDIQNGIKVSN